MKEIIEKYKSYIIILVILIAYLLFAFFQYINEPKKSEKSYIVTRNSQFLYIKDKGWETIADRNEFNWRNYTIYVDNKLIGDYNLQYNNKWYIFDNERNSIKYEGKIIAYSDIEAQVYDYNLNDITASEKQKIDNYLTNKNINLVNYRTASSKVELDIDDDGETEKIYMVISDIDNNLDNIFSMVLIEENNKLTEIVSNVVPSGSERSIIIYNIYGFIDIENDKKPEIIISRMEFSQPDKSCEMIIKKENSKFSKVMGCNNTI